MGKMFYFCCREGSIVVDSELVFNNETALPNTSDVVETLKNASSSPGFNFTVNITSIVAEGKAYFHFQNVETAKFVFLC